MAQPLDAQIRTAINADIANVPVIEDKVGAVTPSFELQA
jgi:hypothetical protein